MYLVIDCAPGSPRPDVFAQEVFNRLGMEPVNTDSRIFGAWTWRFPVDEDKYNEVIKDWIKQYMNDLYSSGRIRGAEWSLS